METSPNGEPFRIALFDRGHRLTGQPSELERADRERLRSPASADARRSRRSASRNQHSQAALPLGRSGRPGGLKVSRSAPIPPLQARH